MADCYVQPACSAFAAQVQEITCCGAQCQETVINFVSATAPATSHPGLLAHRVYFASSGRDSLPQVPALPARELPERRCRLSLAAFIPLTSASVCETLGQPSLVAAVTFWQETSGT